MSLFSYTTASGRTLLRIGLLFDGEEMPCYGVEIASLLANASFARVVLLVRDPSRAKPHPWLFETYWRRDAEGLEAGSDPTEGMALPPALAQIPVVTGEKPESAIQAAALDVLIDLREEPSSEVAGRVATHGTWSLRFPLGRPGCFWEVVDSIPTTRVELRVSAGEEGDSRVLGEVVAPTAGGLSWARNRLAPYWSAVTLVLEKLRELHECGWEAVAERTSPAASGPSGSGRTGPPGSSGLAAWLLRSAALKVARRAVRRPRAYEWRLGVRATGRPLLERDARDQADGFRWLPAPAGRHRADPFLLEQGGRVWCFFEDIDRVTGRGRIAALDVGADAVVGDALTVLDQPYHLSYPCLFTDHGELFMIPESSENETVELYRCRQFPADWVLESVLHRDLAVDTTVHVHDGRYWFFTTRLEPRSLASQLWLYSSSTLTGGWTSHPQNPISMDVRNARGAGAIVSHQGRAYRPSQDCSIRYGRAFSLNEIVTLTPDRFEERPVVTVEPMEGLVGTHTYARCGAIEMIDGCARVPVPYR